MLETNNSLICSSFSSSSSFAGNRSRPTTQSGNSSAIKESADSNSATIDDVNDAERIDRLSKKMNTHRHIVASKDFQQTNHNKNPSWILLSLKLLFGHVCSSEKIYYDNAISADYCLAHAGNESRRFK